MSTEAASKKKRYIAIAVAVTATIVVSVISLFLLSKMTDAITDGKTETTQTNTTVEDK